MKRHSEKSRKRCIDFHESGSSPDDLEMTSSASKARLEEQRAEKEKIPPTEEEEDEIVINIAPQNIDPSLGPVTIIEREVAPGADPENGSEGPLDARSDQLISGDLPSSPVERDIDYRYRRDGEEP